MPCIEESCYWLDRHRSGESAERLTGPEKADVVLVGGGFTGLWAAHFLTALELGLKIVLLEQGVVGYGASGRNAGIVGACLDHSHSLAIKHFGLDEARRMAHLGVENLDELGAFAQDCGYERTGQLMMSLDEEQLADAFRTVELSRGLGLAGHRVLAREEAQAEIHSPLYAGARFSPDGGILDPVALVRKLAREARCRGVRILERTRVTALEGTTVRCENGHVRADRVILATDAYTHHLAPRLLRWFVPLYDYIIVSEPLDASQKACIGWKNRQGVTDGRAFFNYYRLTPDDRILWGTSEAKYYPRNRVEAAFDHSEEHRAALLASFARFFPQLGGLRFPYSWGGPIASTSRLTPFFGSLEKGRIVYGLGYTGHGIGTTRLGGKILAHMVTKRPTELQSLRMVHQKPVPFPPEPFRSHAIRTVTRSLKEVDEGGSPSPLLRLLDALGIGFSS